MTLAVCWQASLQAAESPVWQPVPLRTSAQKNAGVPGGEGFQQVMSIVYAPSNPLRVYLSSDTSQVWRSDNGGNDWHKGNTGFLANGARSLFVHPRNPDIVLAAGFLGKEESQVTSEMNPVQGIFLSTDGADSWKFVHSTAFYKQGSRAPLFAIDSRSIDKADFTVYVGTYEDGLLFSTDGGHNWQSTAFKEKQITSIAESWEQPGLIFLATTSGLYSFFEGRITQLGTGLPSWPRSISTSQQKPTTVYAALGQSGVYRSNDSGRTFTFSGYGLSPFVDWTDVACSNIDAKRLYLRANESNIGPFFSNDGGLSWHKTVDPNVGDLAPLEGMYFSSPIASHPSMANVALLASNGRATILRTEDGGQTWRYSGSGYMGGRVIDIAFTDPNTFYVALTDHGLWQTRDGGQTFDPLPVPNLGGKSVKAVAVSGQNLFIGIGGWALQSLATSSDTGLSWVEHKELTGVFNRIQIHTGRPEVIYAGKYRTLNAGFVWTPLQYEIRAVFQGNNDEVFAVDDAGEESRILVSKDMGQTWNSPYPPLPVTAKNVRALAVHPNRDTEICVGTSVGIFILGENGWNKRDQQHGLTLDHFGGCYIETILYDDDDPRIIYAGRRSPGRGVSNGIFRSEDGGETWNSWNGNLGNYLNIWSIHCSPFDDTVFIGTSHGTFRAHSGLLASKPLPIKYFVVNPD